MLHSSRAGTHSLLVAFLAEVLHSDAQDSEVEVKLALLSNYPTDPKWIYGGVQAAAYHLVQGLARFDDLDLHVVHCSSEISADRTVRDGKVTVHSIRLPRHRVLPNLIASIPRLVKTLRTISPDLANAHTSPYAFAALRAGTPTLYTIHGVAHRELRYAKGLRNMLALTITSAYDRNVVRRVDDVIAISPYVEREYRARTGARFHLVENPVGDDYFQISGAAVSGRVLFAGTLSPHKGTLRLLEALKVVAAQVPEVQLRLAGRSGAGDYQRRLQRWVVENGLDTRVSFLGPLNTDAMHREYAECALVVLPSLVETAPLVILEAMAAARPVVATRVGGVPDLVEDRVTGFLVPPNEVEPLVDRMFRLLGDRELRETMGRRAREVSRNRFQRDRVAARYHEIYREVLSRQHTGGLGAKA